MTRLVLAPTNGLEAAASGHFQLSRKAAKNLQFPGARQSLPKISVSRQDFPE
jgi:hypothetical protein